MGSAAHCAGTDEAAIWGDDVPVAAVPDVPDAAVEAEAAEASDHAADGTVAAVGLVAHPPGSAATGWVAAALDGALDPAAASRLRNAVTSTAPPTMATTDQPSADFSFSRSTSADGLLDDALTAANSCMTPR